ncbi:uncharacterized protein LOC127744671 [Arachis duranensis]|uniref:Uncharacterized protein LOC127744671 n=1 Tax=Arachis duranensis TaxID=130453 RepID=A0A9C6WK65_ARADU|nr:uncharacterized protein LOC127744671 [Arachis duranensis]
MGRAWTCFPSWSFGDRGVRQSDARARPWTRGGGPRRHTTTTTGLLVCLGNVHLAGIAHSKPFGVSPCSHCAKQAFWATRFSARPFGARGKEPDTLTTHTPLIRHHGLQTQHARTNSPPHALEHAGKRKHTGVPSQLRWAGFGGSDEEHSRDSPRREVLWAIIEQPHRLRLSNPHSKTNTASGTVLRRP